MSTPGSGALALAEQAHALVQAQPRQALELAQRARDAARAERDVPAELAAVLALGWAQGVLGDTSAEATLRAGIRLGARHGDRRGVGLLRRHLAGTLAVDGRLREARREIEAAMALLSGRDRVRSEVHRVAIHRATHSTDPETHRKVCADAARALRTLRRNGDSIWETRLLYNRGLLFLDRGELGRAEADLRASLELRERLGLTAGIANVEVALASIALLRGDIVSCLDVLDRVEATLPPGQPHYGLSGWRARALAQARLLPEARAAAGLYIELCSRTGRGDYVPGALLDLADIACASGDPDEAARLATSATHSFAARGKPVSAALARSARLRAQILADAVVRSSIRDGIATAALLTDAGWRRDAQRTRILVARAALALGSRQTARRQLELAQSVRRTGTVVDRIELSYTNALLHLAERDEIGANRLLLDGLRLVEDYRAALGEMELRASVAGIGIELARQGLAIALESRRPSRILVWAERLRAGSLQLPLVRAPKDTTLVALQADLRRVCGQIRDAEDRGSPPGALHARQRRLEAAVRARARHLHGSGPATASTPHREIAAQTLGERALVEFISHAGALWALTIAGDDIALHELGADDSAPELEWLRFSLERLAAGRGRSGPRAAALGSAESTARALDRLLVEPLLPAIGDAPVVVVPTGALHVLPWAALPSLAARPVVVAPSLTLWLGLAGLPRSRRRKTVIVAGPRLRYSAAEVRDIAALHPSATVLYGRAATARTALTALDGAALAHLACHGLFRSDSPLFSSLELADGPLNVYELQQLKRAPEVVVLSACDLGASTLHPGDELLGLTAALLAMGTRTVIASVVPVNDAAARRLMVALHRNLVAGLSPAAALAHAQAGAPAPGFVCLGSG
jgi:CHAT domain